MTFERDFGLRRSTIAGDGLDLHLVETASAGDQQGPPVLFVHGYPDTHAVWLPTVARLVDDLSCVLYDVRGAGGSGVPESPAGYHVSHLVNDLVAVIDAVSPTRPVHIVGHDWGSVQAWEAVLLAGVDPRLRGRIASYTTISGPSLHHFGAWAATSMRRGWRSRRELARQALHSWYVLAFQVPVVPEVALRRMLRSSGATARLLGTRHATPTVARDAVNGLGLYRANLGGDCGTRHPRRTDIPVQLIVPLRDAYLTPAVYDDLPRLCSDLTRHDVDAGHWVQQSRPDDVARLVSEFVSAHSAPNPADSSD